MRAYHFLADDWTANSGNEPAWQVGEERTCTGKIRLCATGYHSSSSWYDALGYARGNVACIVEISEPVAKDKDKQVSRTRKLLAGKNVERELRLWGCDCAERALLREREHGREPDKRSWDAITVARRYADGKASKADLAAARAAAGAAAWAAARAAAWDAARAAAGAAAWDAARDATWAAARAAAGAAEIEWQKAHLGETLDAALAGAASAV